MNLCFWDDSINLHKIAREINVWGMLTGFGLIRFDTNPSSSGPNNDVEKLYHPSLSSFMHLYDTKETYQQVK